MGKRIAVYCASSMQLAQHYFDHATEIATAISKAGHHIVFGGGSSGLMGAVADAAIAQNGKITGVIPQFMKEVEWDHPGVTDMIYTETMAERKEKMLEDVDIALALPGGSGTFEEIFEAITLKRLGQIHAEIMFYNQDGFYDAMNAMFVRTVADKFMTEDHLKAIQFFDNQIDLMQAINTQSEQQFFDIQTAVVR